MKKEEFVKLLHGATAAMPNKAPDFSNKEAIFIWWDNFKDFSKEEFSFALRKSLAGQNYFPTINQILEKMGQKKLSAEDRAAEVPFLIKKAMIKYGRGRPNEARDFMGEIAWKVVESYGSWKQLCENTEEANFQTDSAQQRRLAKTYFERDDYEQYALESKMEHLKTINCGCDNGLVPFEKRTNKDMLLCECGKAENYFKSNPNHLQTFIVHAKEKNLDRKYLSKCLPTYFKPELKLIKE